MQDIFCNHLWRYSSSYMIMLWSQEKSNISVHLGREILKGIEVQHLHKYIEGTIRFSANGDIHPSSILQILFPCFHPQWAYVDKKEFAFSTPFFFSKFMHGQSVFFQLICLQSISEDFKRMFQFLLTLHSYAVTYIYTMKNYEGDSLLMNFTSTCFLLMKIHSWILRDS